MRDFARSSERRAQLSVMKIERALTRQQRKDQIRYWRQAQLQASNQDELNEATARLNELLDEWVPEQTSTPVGKP